MLLEFSVGNFRSFHNIQKLDLRATTLKSEDRETDLRNIVNSGEEHILKTVGLYGPNGSGKSNLIKALSLFCTLVRTSLQTEGVFDFASDPFKLATELSEHDGFFQVQILIDNKKYRYGFTIGKEADVQQEWLFGPAEKKETYYFKRTGSKVEFNKERFDEASQLPLDSLRPNTLFLSFVSAFKGEQSQKIRRFISTIRFENRRTSRLFRRPVIMGGGSIFAVSTNSLLRDGKGDLVLEWLKAAGLPYKSIEYRELNGSDPEVILLKSIVDENGNEKATAEFDLEQTESAGTQKFYELIGRLYDKFNNGGVIVADEIDNNFHPSLLQQFIKMFNDPKLNKAGAQLVFTSHDTNLLKPSILRRDQIYFAEKSLHEETILYSLAALKGIRNNSDFAQQYLAGYYGALPYLYNLQQDYK